MDRGGVPRGSGATGDVQWQQNHDIIFADVHVSGGVEQGNLLPIPPSN